MTSTARIGAIAGVVGAVLVAVGVVLEPRQALTSYLFAYVAVLTIVLGALLQLMIGHLTGARWFAPFRGITLAIIGTLPALAILALPVLIGVHAIYPWTWLSALAPAVRVVVARKQAWLNVPFFLGRAVVYLVVWIAFAQLMRRLSRESANATEADTVRSARRLRKASAGGAIAVGVTLTFAAFDWIMSLEPTWYSTIYGVYVFAGGILAALGLIALIAYRFDVGGASAILAADREHAAAMGKLLLTFTIFWGYIAFSQYLIIWIANIPSEAAWYLPRTMTSWGGAALVIVIGQFAIPLILLLSWRLKRDPRVLAGVGAWLLVVHLVDSYWLVLPSLHPAGMRPSWLDGAALLAVAGIVVAAGCWRAGRDTTLRA